MDHTAPTKDEFKLIIDNALLEQEKRLNKSMTESLSNQDKVYMEHIVNLTSRVSRLETRLGSMRGLIAGLTSGAAVLGGLVGFFISQLLQRVG